MRPRNLISCLKGQSRVCRRSPRPMTKILSGAFSIILVVASLFALLAANVVPVSAQTLTTLWSFGSYIRGRGQDGSYPNGGLVLDPQGNLYGTTTTGGAHTFGTVFKVSPSGTETILYNLHGIASGPVAGLLRDQSGNLYGTTADTRSYGYKGCEGIGAVFELAPSGKETVLHRFSQWKKKPPDVYCPVASLIFDAQGNLYSTALDGGNYKYCYGSGCGGVFRVTQSGSEKLLYTFNGGSDGAYPGAPLIFDAEGNLYGTTSEGGTTSCNPPYGCGTVFKLTPSGTETVLYRFGGADGNSPAGLVFDAEGNLYGTTFYGGITSDCSGYQPGCGVVFELTPSGMETVLYSFTGGADGAYPSGGLIFDSEGNLYGATQNGGAYGCGVIFELSPSGTETVLYSFTGGDDGAVPNGPLVFDSQGNLYGTTLYGGAKLVGTVFKLAP